MSTMALRCLPLILLPQLGWEDATSLTTSIWISALEKDINQRHLRLLGMLSVLLVSFPSCWLFSWQLRCPFRSFWPEQERRDVAARVILDSSSVISLVSAERKEGKQRMAIWKRKFWMEYRVDPNPARELPPGPEASLATAANQQAKIEVAAERDLFDQCLWRLAASQARRAAEEDLHPGVARQTTAAVLHEAGSSIFPQITRSKTKTIDSNWYSRLMQLDAMPFSCLQVLTAALPNVHTSRASAV